MSDRNRLCQSLLCPCWVFGDSCQQLRSSPMLCCLVYACTLLNPLLWWVNALLGCYYRYRVRKRYSIAEGNLFCDLCTYIFCCPCVLMQSSRQTDFELHRIRVSKGIDCGCRSEQGAMLRIGQREFHFLGSGTPILGCRFIPSVRHRLLPSQQMPLNRTLAPIESMPPLGSSLRPPYVFEQNPSNPVIPLIVRAQGNPTEVSSETSRTNSIEISGPHQNNQSNTGDLSVECAEEIDSILSEEAATRKDFSRTTIREFFARVHEEEPAGSAPSEQESDKPVVPESPEIGTIFTMSDVHDDGGDDKATDTAALVNRQE